MEKILMKEVQIGALKVGPAHPPLVVAELSANHLGSLERAFQLIEKAKEAGVSAVKLQTYTPQTLTLDLNEGQFLIEDTHSPWQGRALYDLYEEAHTPRQWHRPIFDFCRRLGLEVFSSPFDETAVDFLEELDPPCYKIASLEIVDLPLIRKIAKTGKPILLSTGGATLSEIEAALRAAKEGGCEQIVLLKCTAAYPADPQTMNLKTIAHLSETFDLLVGLSDHSLGIGVAVASVCFGACLIEKHLTLSRQEGGLDSSFSMEPQEMAQLVQEAKRAWQAIGKVCYDSSPQELATTLLRPSLYFVESLPCGAEVRLEHVQTLRPAGGLLPRDLEAIIGLTLTASVKRGEPVSWRHFKKDAH